jgi:nucleoside-diphosphate-sugar epimerase
MHLLHALAAKESKVIAAFRSEKRLHDAKKIFDLLPDANQRWSRIEWIKTDLLDIQAVDALLQDATQVYHCAAMVSMDPRDDRRMYVNNTQITENVVNSCLKRGNIRLVHVSSVAALGDSQNGQAIDEQTVWNDPENKSVYAISKYACEQIVWRATEEGLNAAIVNPSIILGPGNWEIGSTQLFKKIHKGFPLYTDATQGFVDARDCAEGMILLMNSGISARRFLLSAENMHLKTLMDKIADALEVKPPWIRIRSWMGEIAWRLMAVFSFLSRTRPVITKNMVRSGSESHFYGNKRSIEELDLRYRPIEETVQYTCDIYRALEA